jgi:hypothetical protein
MNLVFLHGAAASGKLTVGRVLAERLNYPLFHNHLIVDALTAVFPFGSTPFVKLREQFWLATFAESARSDTPIIFTFTPESTVPAGFAERARSAVADAGGRVDFVRLEVSDAEQERRIGAPSRHEFAKLTDVETLRRLRSRADRLDAPPADLVIDTEQFTPDDAARQIIETFALTPIAQRERYPET